MANDSLKTVIGVVLFIKSIIIFSEYLEVMLNESIDNWLNFFSELKYNI